MGKPFFTRRNLLVVVVVALIVYLLFAFVALGSKRIANERHRASVRAAQQRFDALSPAEKAIRRAETYQMTMTTSAHPFQRLLFDYLQRSYSLPAELSVANSPLDIPTTQTQNAVELRYLARIAFPEKVFKDSISVPLAGTSLTNVYAANCDNLSLPKNFWDTMQDNYGRGEYDLTHVALAFRFIRDNNCDIPDSAMVLESQVNKGMVTIAGDSATGADLRYEAIAFLLLSGNRSDVKQGWIDQIAKEQMPNGGWAAEAGSKTANDHSTVLAMWALLQYSRPEVKYQPLIRH